MLHEDLFGCQNHIYDEAHLRTLYGFIFNDEEEFRAGEESTVLLSTISKKTAHFGVRHREAGGLGHITGWV